MNIYRAKSCLPVFLLLALVLSCLSPANGESKAGSGIAVSVPILLYHRFGPAVADSMTVTTPVFESHLKYLKDNGYTVIPLRQLLEYLVNKTPLPAKSVVITADDGHRTVYTEMFPLIKKYNIPVTLFIYPSAISNAPYAMTWEQLREMNRSGLIDIQSHSYWHPNFKKDKKKMAPAEYERSVEMQFNKPKDKIGKELGVNVDLLAWPFGIYDDELVRKAGEAGYIAAFTIERRHVTISENIMTLPRYLMVDNDRGRTFEMLLKGSASKRKAGY
ncbi:MAG: polysaccharide deacetylase family protein [Nitrospirae bacterium]|nr:polysaccharide deacetylase family protein [Nitrospirota bacterium]